MIYPRSADQVGAAHRSQLEMRCHSPLVTRRVGTSRWPVMSTYRRSAIQPLEKPSAADTEPWTVWLVTGSSPTASPWTPAARRQVHRPDGRYRSSRRADGAIESANESPLARVLPRHLGVPDHRSSGCKSAATRSANLPATSCKVWRSPECRSAAPRRAVFASTEAHSTTSSCETR